VFNATAEFEDQRILNFILKIEISSGKLSFHEEMSIKRIWICWFQKLQLRFLQI